MGLKELREALAAAKTEVRNLMKTDVAAAEAKMEEVRKLQKSLEIAEELAVEEERELLRQKEEREKANKTTSGEVSEMRAITKYIMGADITEEERNLIKIEKEKRVATTSTGNAAVLPKQFINQLIEIEKGFGSLEEYCDIIPVTKNEGTMPISVVDETDLPEVPEGDDITDAQLTTSDMSYKCSKVGEIYTLTSEVVDDAEVEIEGLARRNFTAKTVRTKNTKIVKIIKDNAVAPVVAPSSYKDINNAIDAAVLALKNGIATFTNSAGYAYLKNLTDKNDRPLNLVTEMNGKYYFNGKELVVVDDAILPTAEGKTVTCYVCNPKELVKMFKRNEFTVARSTEAGFTNDTVKVRILGRFDVKKGYARNCVVISF